MPKIIELSIPERFRLTDLIGGQSASNTRLQSDLLKLLAAVEMGDEEKTRIGFQIVQQDGRTLYGWSPDTTATTYSIELTDAQASLLVAILENDGNRYAVTLAVRGDEWAPRILETLKAA